MPVAARRHRPGKGKRHRLRRDAFYSLARWKRFRRLILRDSPVCVDPTGRHPGRIVVATDVDHIIPRRERPDLEYDATNCQALCKGCHSAKTRRE